MIPLCAWYVLDGSLCVTSATIPLDGQSYRENVTVLFSFASTFLKVVVSQTLYRHTCTARSLWLKQGAMLEAFIEHCSIVMNTDLILSGCGKD